MIKYFCDICGDELGKKAQANAFISIVNPEIKLSKEMVSIYFCDKCLDKMAEVFNIDKKIIEKCRRGEE